MISWSQCPPLIALLAHISFHPGLGVDIDCPDEQVVIHKAQFICVHSPPSALPACAQPGSRHPEAVLRALIGTQRAVPGCQQQVHNPSPSPSFTWRVLDTTFGLCPPWEHCKAPELSWSLDHEGACCPSPLGSSKAFDEPRSQHVPLYPALAFLGNGRDGYVNSLTAYLKRQVVGGYPITASDLPIARQLKCRVRHAVN